VSSERDQRLIVIVAVAMLEPPAVSRVAARTLNVALLTLRRPRRTLRASPNVTALVPAVVT
jgi:hypothetical protein